MTKVYYMSDLHLEINDDLPLTVFGKSDPDGILLVAGDTYIAARLNADCYLTASENRTFIKFLNWCTGYKKVYFILGNHEHYKGEYGRTAALFKRALDEVGKGVLTLLDNTFDMIDANTLVVGTTLWTNMNNNNPIDHLQVGNGMSDFRVIAMNNRWFTTHDSVRAHMYAINYIQAVADNFPGKNVIVLSHHAPSWQSNVGYETSSISAGYCSALESMIEEFSNIQFWVHGHTHVNVDYMISQCRIMTNQLGYAYGQHADGSSKEFLDIPQPRYFEI